MRNEELEVVGEVGNVGGKEVNKRIDFVDLSHARQFASALALHSLNRKGANAYTPWSGMAYPAQLSRRNCRQGSENF